MCVCVCVCVLVNATIRAHASAQSSNPSTVANVSTLLPVLGLSIGKQCVKLYAKERINCVLYKKDYKDKVYFI